MKKFIRAESVKPINMEVFQDLESEAYRCGYNLTVDTDASISLEAIEHEDKMPEIHVSSVNNNGRIEYNAEMVFQTLNTEDENYYDSIEYYLKKWMKAAEFVTFLMQWSPSDYEEYDE